MKAPLGYFGLFKDLLFYSAVIHIKGRRDVLVYTGMYVV